MRQLPKLGEALLEAVSWARISPRQVVAELGQMGFDLRQLLKVRSSTRATSPGSERAR